MTKHVVMFSGGIGSWATAKRVAAIHGTDDLFLVFCDVRGNSTNPHVGEDPDTYRFIDDAVKNIGGTYIYLNAGLDIWELFKKVRLLGNSRIAPCSHKLKQAPAWEWIKANCDPDDTVIYVGIDWSEVHRLPSIEKNYLPYKVEAPMTVEPFLDKKQMIDLAREEGIEPPALYAMGFPHNNCGGGCVRAGQGQFKMLLQLMPERFAEWERGERSLQEHLGKEVTILKETVNGVSRPLPLNVLRERVMSQPSLIDDFDIGGCACFVDEPMSGVQ